MVRLKVFTCSALMVVLVAVSVAQQTSEAPSAKGVISQALVPNLSTIFPNGSKPEQIRALCGDPEYINETKEFTVWRYLSGDDFILFAFEKGTGGLAEIGQRPIHKAKAADAIVATSKRASEAPRAQMTWKDFYSKPGRSAVAEIGASREAVLDAFATIGVPRSIVGCEADRSQPSVTTCTVDTTTEAWKHAAPPGAVDSLFILLFQDDRFRGSLLLISCADVGSCVARQTEVRAALAAAFNRPAEPLGWWKRKTTSMLLPLAWIAEGARWEDESRIGSVLRGTFGPPSAQVPALLVYAGEKDVEQAGTR